MQKKYKLVAVDIDGTLLNNRKELLAKTQNTIMQAIAQGLVFTIATGRAQISTKKIADKFDCDIPLILYNGGVIRMSQSNKIIYEKLLGEKASKAVYRLINEYNGTFVFYANEKPYCNRLDIFTIEYAKATGVNPLLISSDWEIPFAQINKFLWFDIPEKLAMYQKELLPKIQKINYFTSGDYLLEIVNEQVSKANAIQILSDYYRIKPEEVIAIGDGENDIPMLKYAGLGIAMANANSKVKESANYITSSNEEDGVGLAIEKFYLKNNSR